MNEADLFLMVQRDGDDVVVRFLLRTAVNLIPLLLCVAGAMPEEVEPPTDELKELSRNLVAVLAEALRNDVQSNFSFDEMERAFE